MSSTTETTLALPTWMTKWHTTFNAIATRTEEQAAPTPECSLTAENGTTATDYTLAQSGPDSEVVECLLKAGAQLENSSDLLADAAATMKKKSTIIRLPPLAF